MPGSQSNAAAKPLEKRLTAYGCTDVIPLDERLFQPRQLEYLDLLPARNNQTPSLTAVAEHQGTALLYLVDACGDSHTSPASLAAVRRRLANRSDPAWVGVVQAGSLEIFPIGFHETADTQPIVTIQEHSKTAPLFFQSLVHGTFEETKKLRGTDYVYRKVFDLLTQTTNAFVPRQGKSKIDALEVLSMAGRALFFRFLIDRRIVLETELSGPNGICSAATDLKDAFSTVQKAAKTSAWLDATFNGDFLPLVDESIPFERRAAREKAYLSFYNQTQELVGDSIFTHLQAILRGWKAVGNAFQPELDWGDLDFAHIPVGVLSQVYESFSHRADPRTARDTSIHYTPRTIAKLMVEEAFAAAKKPADAMVLDSSCGAGIFLVLAFRRLVRERWLRDDKRPGTATIQDILYNQIRGFDISESALRLAALGLYITAIELNASPRPPDALKFPRNLRGEVLYWFGTKDDRENKPAVFPLGSLGPEVPSEFDKKFDIVIGNAPWTRLRDRKGKNALRQQKQDSATTTLNLQFTAIARRVLEARGLSQLATVYQNPDKNPDLPFLWRSMEWAKEDGVISLAMPARLFGRTTGLGFEAWRAVLQSVQVTGLISGADMRWSSVWKGIKMPFCIFFAKNAIPMAGHRFCYAAPLNEPGINGEGRFRIDYEMAQPILAVRVEEQPWLLKTLSLGTWLDVELMETLSNQKIKTISARWAEWDPKRKKTGQGFNRSVDLTQKFVDFLANLPVIEPQADGFGIAYNDLKTYGATFGTNDKGQSSAHMPRRKELYQPPLVIIPQSPGIGRTSPQAYLSNRPLAFSQSYYGYSCAGYPEAPTLAALLYLLAHSTLFAYFCLMSSRRSGFDRQTFNKEEFDALPCPDIVSLDDSSKARIQTLARHLQANAKKPWQEINEFIFELYGLDRDAVQVAEDTLFFAASYRKAGRKAFDNTTSNTRVDFVRELRESLEPYFDVCGEHVAVRDAEFQHESWQEPWFFLSVSRESETVKVNDNLIQKAMDAANHNGCSRITVHAPKKSGLLLGLLNQRRWWTITRARLCAQHIIRECLSAFGLPEAP